MTKHINRLLVLATFCTAVADGRASAQTTKRPCSSGSAKTKSQSSLTDDAIRSLIGLYSDSTTGQTHAEDERQFRGTAKQFIAALSAADTKSMQVHTTIPWLFQDELTRDESSLGDQFRGIMVPKVFAASDKRIAILYTLEQLEALMGKRIPPKPRKVWSKHISRSSRIAVVSGGPMLVGVSLRKRNEKYSVSGLLFAYSPKEDDSLLKAVTNGLLTKWTTAEQ